MTEWLDPSVIDELDPDNRDPEFDIYSPDCPNQPPYTQEFVDRFRAAQIARNRRITEVGAGPTRPAASRSAGRSRNAPSSFTARCATCAGSIPRSTLRTGGPNWTYMGDPQAVNVGPVGPCPLHYPALLAQPMELRSVQRQGPDECRAHPSRRRCCRSRTPPTKRCRRRTIPRSTVRWPRRTRNM